MGRVNHRSLPRFATRLHKDKTPATVSRSGRRIPAKVRLDADPVKPSQLFASTASATLLFSFFSFFLNS